MAAFAIAEHLVTAEKGEALTRCRAFLLHIPEIDPIVVDELLTSAGVRADEFVRRLPEDARVRLADELRRRAQ